MSEPAATATRQTAAPEASSKNELKLQRKCACGQHTLGGHECSDCKKKRSKLQRWSVDRPPPVAVLHAHGPVGCPAMDTPDVGLDLSHVRARTPALRTRHRLQLAPASEAPAAAPTLAPSPRDQAPDTSTAPAEPPGRTFIVDDDATALEPGQMKKSDFLNQLRAALCEAADAVLARAGRTTDGCPYLAFWFDYYGRQDSQHVERAIRRYAPETARAASARDYIPLLVARVRQATEAWVRTGRVPGVPEGVPDTLPAAPSAARDARPAASPQRVQRKARGGGPRGAEDPAAIQDELGGGRPFDGAVRARMEAAFGTSFGAVRLHTGRKASTLSDDLNARAFTVGRHVAFGAGEYRPGTMVGDALIAHELAHVVQQQGTSSTVAPLAPEGTSYDALEQDADAAAGSVVASLWGRTQRALHDISQHALPQLRSGLRVQRCCTETTPAPRLTITQLKKPTTQHCGGVEWPVQFGLKGANSNTEGWIVQRVDQTFDVKDCDGKKVDVLARTKKLVRKGFTTTPGGFSVTEPTDPSWWPFSEAWEVDDGTVRFGDTSRPHKNDTYRVAPMGPHPDLPPTKGTVDIEGKADYFDCLWLPFSFSTGNPPVTGLPTARPPVSLSGGSGAKDHDLSIEWNCCPDASEEEKKTKVVSHTP